MNFVYSKAIKSNKNKISEYVYFMFIKFELTLLPLTLFSLFQMEILERKAHPKRKIIFSKIYTNNAPKNRTGN